MRDDGASMLAFRRIFRHRGAPAMTSAAFVGRLPMAMFGLAVTLLVVGETGSYATAGAVGAAVTLCDRRAARSARAWPTNTARTGCFPR